LEIISGEENHADSDDERFASDECVKIERRNGRFNLGGK